MLMSDAGGGTNISNVTFTFDDAAANVIPNVNKITNGTYRCANYLTQTDPFPGFAPTTVWSNTSLASFNGISPNGVWSLYIVDDAAQDVGSISGGWTLNITTGDPVIPGADLSVAINDSPDPVGFGGSVVYSIAVTNHGPASATGVMLTNIMPPEANFISVSGMGSYTLNGNILVGSLGNLQMGEGTVVQVTMNAPNANTLLTFDSTVGAGQMDLNMGNNHSSIKTTVSDTVPVVPALFAARKNGQLVLSWQSASTNIVLQSSSLMGGSWGGMTNAPVVSNGVSTITMPFGGGTKFFRLKKLP